MTETRRERANVEILPREATGTAASTPLRVELADPEGDLLREIADPVFTPHDVRLTYRMALRTMERVDWKKVNQAIIDRWGITTLKRIKTWAWKEQS